MGRQQQRQTGAMVAGAQEPANRGALSLFLRPSGRLLAIGHSASTSIDPPRRAVARRSRPCCVPATGERGLPAIILRRRFGPTCRDR
jgi:hypothetical protein